MRIARIYFTLIAMHICLIMHCAGICNASDSPLPQEKIILALDRSGYIAGDTIRFRAFLMDAYTEKELKNFSQYIYVELIDPFGKTINRVKVKHINNAFIGIIPLDKEMAESTYTLAAYTMYMQNMPSGYFWRSHVDIASGYSSRYNLEYSVTDGVLTADLTERASKSQFKCNEVRAISPDNQTIYNARDRSTLSLNIPHDYPVVKLKFDNYEKFVALPSLKDDIVLDFYPEGGNLINGISNAVAFKATDSHGRHIDISGHILTSEGDTVARLETFRPGIGKFHLVPCDDFDYFASINGKTFNLPKSSTSGKTSLQIITTGQKHILANVIGQRPEILILCVDSKGNKQFFDTIREFPVMISKTNLNKGLLRFSLFDENGQKLSSRLVFNSYDNPDLKSSSAIPAGNYTLSTGLSSPICRQVESMLLQQDFDYFVDSLDCYLTGSKHSMEMDALLLTMKADRYYGNIFTSDFPVEIGGEISGTVKSRWRGRPIKNAKINIIAPSIEFAAEAYTDSVGKFVLEGFDWPDGTTFVCRAFGTRGQNEHNFTITSDSFPNISPIPISYELSSKESFNNYWSNHEENSILLKEVEVTAPMSERDLKTVMFEAMGIKSLNTDDFNNKAMTSYEEAIRSFPALTIQNGKIISLRGRNSVYGNGGSVEIWIDGAQWTASFLSSESDHMISPDEREMQVSQQVAKTARIMTGGLLPDDLAQRQYASQLSVLSELEGSYPFHIVKSIDYIPPHSALFLSATAAHGSGALMITTKSGQEINWAQNLFIKIHQPIGYQNNPTATTPRLAGRSLWMPILTKSSDIPEAHVGDTISICGFTDDGDFIVHDIEAR